MNNKKKQEKERKVLRGRQSGYDPPVCSDTGRTGALLFMIPLLPRYPLFWLGKSKQFSWRPARFMTGTCVTRPSRRAAA